MEVPMGFQRLQEAQWEQTVACEVATLKVSSVTQPKSLFASDRPHRMDFTQTTQELDYSPAFLFLSYSSSCLLHAEWPYLITGATGPKVSS